MEAQKLPSQLDHQLHAGDVADQRRCARKNGIELTDGAGEQLFCGKVILLGTEALCDQLLRQGYRFARDIAVRDGARDDGNRARVDAVSYGAVQLIAQKCRQRRPHRKQHIRQHIGCQSRQTHDDDIQQRCQQRHTQSQHQLHTAELRNSRIDSQWFQCTNLSYVRFLRKTW